MHRFYRSFTRLRFNFPNFEPSQHMNSAKRKFQFSFSFRFTVQATPDQCHPHRSSLFTMFLPLQEKLREINSFKENPATQGKRYSHKSPTKEIRDATQISRLYKCIAKSFIFSS